MKLFKLFYIFKIFIDELSKSPFKSWLIVSFGLFFLIHFFETTGSFLGDFFVSVVFGVVLLIVFLFLLKIFLLILDVIENIWRPFLDQNEYKNLILHYENTKHQKLKKELDNLQNYLKDNKLSYNNDNFVLGVVIGFWIGWLLFDGGSDG